MAPVAHPGRLLKRELAARALSANRLALDLGVPSGRITDILNGRRSINADMAVRLSRSFGFFGFNAALELQYHGRLDEGKTTPPPPAARRELLEAMRQIAETGKGPERQVPSMGCSIKWRRGD